MAGQYELNLRDYWRILRRRKMIVIFTTVMVTVFSSLVLFLQNQRELPDYKSVAKIQIEEKTGADAWASYYGGTDDLTSREMIIVSNAVMERAAKKLEWLPDAVSAEQIAETSKYIRVLDKLKRMMGTEVEGYTNIISISAIAGQAQLAADVANAVADAYREYSIHESNRQADEAFEYVKAQRDSAKMDLSVFMEKLKSYQIEHRVTSIDAQFDAALKSSEQLELGLRETSAHLREIQGMLSEMENTGTLSDKTLESLVFEGTKGVIAKFNDQLTGLTQERETLLETYTENYPDVKEMDKRIADTRKSMTSQLRIKRNGLQRAKETASAELDSLREAYKLLPEKNLEVADLQYEVETRQKLFLLLEEEYQKASIRRRYERVQDVRVIQRAFPGARINPPSSMARALVGTVIGLMLGLVFAFVLETLDTSIGTIEDVEEYVGVSVLGLIPQTSQDDIRDALAERGIEWNERSLDRSARLITYFDPQSSLAESYRQLRTNIQFLVMEREIKTIAVTSSSMQEGKSTTACNLALTTAQLGSRVLLVDTDLRKPSLARTFGVDREPGLTDVILGNYEAEEVIKTVHDIMMAGIGMDDTMMSSWIENLNILTSGAIHPNAAELVNSMRMQELIEQFREEYDIVIFDTPPVLEATDARILATKMDGTLLVYKVGEVARSRLKRMKLLLDSIQAPILGVVLNGLRAEISADFQDMRYYSYYSYGHEDKEKTWWRRSLDRGIRKVNVLLGREEEFEDEFEERPEEVFDEEPEPEEEIELEERSRGTDIRAGLGALFGIYRKLLLGIAGVVVIAGLLWQTEIIRLRTGISYTPKEKISSAGPVSAEPEEVGETIRTGELPISLGTADAPSAPPRPADEDARSDESAAPLTESIDTLASSATPSRQAVERREARPRPPQDISSGRSPFSVHISSHVAQRTAEEEAHRLLQAGYPAFTAPTHRNRVRVLVGSFRTQTEAAREAQRLRREGYADLTAVLRLPYTVRVSTFGSLDAAEAERRQLRGAGHFPYILAHRPASEYTVALGAFSSEKEALRFSRQLDMGGTSYQIVTR